jgi:hypothetical protein
VRLPAGKKALIPAVVGHKSDVQHISTLDYVPPCPRPSLVLALGVLCRAPGAQRVLFGRGSRWTSRILSFGERSTATCRLPRASLQMRFGCGVPRRDSERGVDLFGVWALQRSLD